MKLMVSRRLTRLHWTVAMTKTKRIRNKMKMICRLISMHQLTRMMQLSEKENILEIEEALRRPHQVEVDKTTISYRRPKGPTN